MQDMDILDMNVLDETENDNGMPAEDDEDDMENFHDEEYEDEMMNEEHDSRALESEDEAKDPEVRDEPRTSIAYLVNWQGTNFFYFMCCNRCMIPRWKRVNILPAHQSIWYVSQHV